MSKRFLFSGIVLAFAVAALPVRAADPETKAPAIIVRVKSIDGLLDDAKYVAKLTGNDEEVKQVDGFLRSLLGDKGSEGIHTKRHIGFYGSVSEDFLNSNGALMTPVDEEKNFVALLERFNVQAKKDANGVYAVTLPNVPVPFPVFMRVANKY